MLSVLMVGCLLPSAIPLPFPSPRYPSPHSSAPSFILSTPPLIPLPLPSSCPPLFSSLYPSPHPVRPPSPLILSTPPQGRTKLLQLLFGSGSSVLFGNNEVQFDRKESFLVCDDGLLQLEGAWSQVPSHSDLSGVDKGEWKHHAKLLWVLRSVWLFAGTAARSCVNGGRLCGQ